MFVCAESNFDKLAFQKATKKMLVFVEIVHILYSFYKFNILVQGNARSAKTQLYRQDSTHDVFHEYLLHCLHSSFLDFNILCAQTKVSYIYL